MSTHANRRALTLVCLMILASWTPLASLPTASAHGGIMAEWGSEGSNDPGWMRMDATGGDPSTAQMAMSNLMIDFAPGQSFQISRSRSASTVRTAHGSKNHNCSCPMHRPVF
ncbi:MAG: hypothetical protein Ct9H90mP16_11650 [Candidatus Poseidoniales archaeon]|nr:MAG: hypothetical protein Ct9H90mP16_11650 [Candidatus Poseidoniales archaeon]